VFAVEPRAAYGFRALGKFHLFGDKYIEVPNEPDALVINYYLHAAQEGGALVTISDPRGDRVAQLKGPSHAGINRVQWNMRAGTGPPAGGRGAPGGPSTLREPQGRPEQGRGTTSSGLGGRGGLGGPLLPPGDYRILLEVGGQEETTIGRIRERIQ
jgi:hypothetical protein